MIGTPTLDVTGHLSDGTETGDHARRPLHARNAGMSGKPALEPFLREQEVLILDGGLATELEKRGADLSDELWSARLLTGGPSLDSPAFTLTTSKPAQMSLISASYQASFEGIRPPGTLSQSSSVELMQRSVHLAKEARDQFLAAADLREEVKSTGCRRWSPHRLGATAHSSPTAPSTQANSVSRRKR